MDVLILKCLVWFSKEIIRKILLLNKTHSVWNLLRIKTYTGYSVQNQIWPKYSSQHINELKWSRCLYNNPCSATNLKLVFFQTCATIYRDESLI